MKVPFFAQKLLVAMSAPFQEVHTANVCGHKTHKKGFMHNGKCMTIMEMPLAENGHPDYCLECIGKMSIQCAWCGKPITIGSPITLYIPKKGFNVPDYAVRYGDGDNQALVGCFGWDCADSGADLVGRWLPHGVVYQVPSPTMIAFQTGKIVLVSDTCNYPESMSLHDVG